MKSKTIIGTSGSAGRLAALHRREQAVKQAIAAENIKHQKYEQKTRARLIAIVGETLLEKARGSPDFDLMLRGVLNTADLDPHQRQFLIRIGWL